MHRIDGAGHDNGRWVAEDPATSRPPTEITAEWMNAIQEELISILTAAGVVLNKSNNAQVLAALQLLFVTEADLTDMLTTGDKSTSPQAIAGVVDSTWMTPVKVAESIAERLIPIYTALAGKGGLAVAQTWSGGQRGAGVVLADGATININFAAGNNFRVTLGGNRNLANPSNLVEGQSGVITVIQGGAGGYTLTYGSYYDSAPSLVTTAAARTKLAYYVDEGNRIVIRAIK